MATTNSPQPKKRHVIFDLLDALITKMFVFLLLVLPFMYAGEALESENVESVHDLARGLRLLCTALTLAVFFFSVSLIVAREELQDLTEAIREQNERRRGPEPTANGQSAAEVVSSRENAR